MSKWHQQFPLSNIHHFGAAAAASGRLSTLLSSLVEDNAIFPTHHLEMSLVYTPVTPPEFDEHGPLINPLSPNHGYTTEECFQILRQRQKSKEIARLKREKLQAQVRDQIVQYEKTHQRFYPRPLVPYNPERALASARELLIYRGFFIKPGTRMALREGNLDTLANNRESFRLRREQRNANYRFTPGLHFEHRRLGTHLDGRPQSRTSSIVVESSTRSSSPVSTSRSLTPPSTPNISPMVMADNDIPELDLAVSSSEEDTWSTSSPVSTSRLLPPPLTPNISPMRMANNDIPELDLAVSSSEEDTWSNEAVASSDEETPIPA
ncbi:hypothetical protein EJ08DRAFT_700126 [Tothia fuscella]|uniref:Uncharacterized protein n=1 Tax=Tothia fuscella TaxID=1048955 RepID=A0A9P4NL65_9PEZI|nr:hypothetical protein EJ08DRAFT_700126 [Tothia fuscella]